MPLVWWITADIVLVAVSCAGFGSVSFAAGLLGTGLGGWLQDFLRNRRGAVTDLDNVKAATILLRYTSLIVCYFASTFVTISL